MAVTVAAAIAALVLLFSLLGCSMNVGCCIVPSKGNRCITHDIVAIIIAFPPVSVDVGRPFGAPVEWSSRPSGKGYNKGVTVIFDIVGKNVLTLDARCYRTLGTRHKFLRRRKKNKKFGCYFLQGQALSALLLSG